jgi:Xaa-Pro aminopeptidase
VKLRRLLARENLDGLVVTDLSNVRYLSGFTGSNGMLLVTRTAAWFYTDFRYKEQIRAEVKGVRKQVRARSLFADFPVEHVGGLKRLGVERHNLTLERHKLIRRVLRGSGTRLGPTSNLVLELRRTKSAAEVTAIAAAQGHTDRVFSLLRKMIRPGIRESDLAAEITFRFAKHGGNAFAPIVASGPNGALPHAGASLRKLRKGDAVTMDFGCRTGGYCSDMTRTVFVGKPDPDLLEVYRIVHEAQRRGIAAVGPGVACAAVDRAARQYITDAGYGPYFGHSLGHGVGIDVHEQPVLTPRSKQQLKVGDVVTVEPGIYIPGLGGVRIEDMVLVTRGGCRNLTKSTKRVLTI